MDPTTHGFQLIIVLDLGQVIDSLAQHHNPDLCRETRRYLTILADAPLTFTTRTISSLCSTVEMEALNLSRPPLSGWPMVLEIVDEARTSPPGSGYCDQPLVDFAAHCTTLDLLPLGMEDEYRIQRALHIGLLTARYRLAGPGNTVTPSTYTHHISEIGNDNRVPCSEIPLPR